MPASDWLDPCFRGAHIATPLHAALVQGATKGDVHFPEIRQHAKHRYARSNRGLDFKVEWWRRALGVRVWFLGARAAFHSGGVSYIGGRAGKQDARPRCRAVGQRSQRPRPARGIKQGQTPRHRRPTHRECIFHLLYWKGCRTQLIGTAGDCQSGFFVRRGTLGHGL